MFSKLLILCYLQILASNAFSIRSSFSGKSVASRYVMDLYLINMNFSITHVVNCNITSHRPTSSCLSMKYTLVLVRHGESTWNNENRFTGWVRSFRTCDFVFFDVKIKFNFLFGLMSMIHLDPFII